MATYQYNHYYELYNGSTGKYVNIYGDHSSGAVSNGNTITLYSATHGPDQRWSIEKYGSYARIVAHRGNGNYALNYNTTNSNCILWALSGADDNDTVVSVDPAVSFGGTYYIKLVYRNLYLTAVGTNLKWQSYAGTAAQRFSLQESPYLWPTLSANLNQFYSTSHRGIDIAPLTKAVEGDPIYAFYDGKVTRVFNWDESQGTSNNASMGNCAFVQSNNPNTSIGGAYLRTIYMHMNGHPLVSVGQYVKKGDIIGYMGDTGYSTGVHLHFAMQANSTDMNPESGTDRYVDRDWVNPLSFF